jgi:hypothetical protein
MTIKYIMSTKILTPPKTPTFLPRTGYYCIKARIHALNNKGERVISYTGLSSEYGITKKTLDVCNKENRRVTGLYPEDPNSIQVEIIPMCVECDGRIEIYNKIKKITRLVY